MELLPVHKMAHRSAHPSRKHICLGLQLNMEPDYTYNERRIDPLEHIVDERSIPKLLDLVHLKFLTEVQ